MPLRGKWLVFFLLGFAALVAILNVGVLVPHELGGCVVYETSLWELVTPK